MIHKQKTYPCILEQFHRISAMYTIFPWPTYIAEHILWGENYVAIINSDSLDIVGLNPFLSITLQLYSNRVRGKWLSEVQYGDKNPRRTLRNKKLIPASFRFHHRFKYKSDVWDIVECKRATIYTEKITYAQTGVVGVQIIKIPLVLGAHRLNRRHYAYHQNLFIQKCANLSDSSVDGYVTIYDIQSRISWTEIHFQLATLAAIVVLVEYTDPIRIMH